MHYHVNFDFVFQNLPFLADGLRNTIGLTLATLLVGGLLGLAVALARLSRFRVLQIAALCFVELIRNTPALVQLLWLFYAMPIVVGTQLPTFVAALISFSLYSTAYFAEIYRGGLASIDRGQREAARAIGMTYPQQLRFVVLPQAVRRMLPALANQAIDVLKLTTLASMLPYAELVYHARLLSEQNFRPIEAYTALAVIMSLILIPFSLGAAWLERKAQGAVTTRPGHRLFQRWRKAPTPAVAGRD